MKTEQTLSPEFVRDFFQSREFRSLYSGVPDDTFNKVVRYGMVVGSSVEQNDKIPRCMERLQELIGQAEQNGTTLPSGTVVLSHELGQGSGRFDRSWHAPRGGLWMAMAWADTLLPEYAGLLPLAAGSACCEAVRSFGVDAAVKWVNDIHVQGRKVGGILCETSIGKSSGDRYHLIGIGINCNVEQFPAELHHSAVSMHDILGQEIGLNHFALMLLARLAWNFGLVHLQEELDLEQGAEESITGRKSLVIDAWRRLSDTMGRRVRYGFNVVQQPLYSATVLDIDVRGGLVLQLDDGSRVTEYSGEIIYLDAVSGLRTGS
jgi:BirA family biotin operon repressor/biotin-[acetyl-CoA-carboxylase] ligase